MNRKGRRTMGERRESKERWERDDGREGGGKRDQGGEKKVTRELRGQED